MIYVLRYPLIVLYTVFWGTLGLALSVLDRSGESLIWVARSWVRWILVTCGARVEVSGLEHLDASRPYVVMANHQSVFDTAAIVASLPSSFRFVAKRELTFSRSLRIESGRIHVHYGEPIPTAGLDLDDRQRLKASARSAILAGFEPEFEPAHAPASLTVPEPRGYPEHASRPRG